jgi:hypothetical protein
VMVYGFLAFFSGADDVPSSPPLSAMVAHLLAPRFSFRGGRSLCPSYRDTRVRLYILHRARTRCPANPFLVWTLEDSLPVKGGCVVVLSVLTRIGGDSAMGSISRSGLRIRQGETEKN